MSQIPSDSSLQSYVAGFVPIKERIPLVHVVPSMSIESLIDSGQIDPTANSRANKITRTESGALLGGDGNAVDEGIASRLEGTDVAAELNRPMVHFSLGVPYYRPSFSSNKKGKGELYPCSLIFDGDDIDIDHIYGNDTGSFIMNFQHGHDADHERSTSGNIPRGVTLQGMKLDSMNSAYRYVNAMFGSADAYLHGTTKRDTLDTKNPHATFIHNMLKNPLTAPADAKDASVTAEVKTSRPVSMDKVKGIVMPSAMILNPKVEQFLIDHPTVQFRLYTTSPWVDPDHYQVAATHETYKLYRDMGIVNDVAIEESLFTRIGSTVDRIKQARAEKGKLAIAHNGAPESSVSGTLQLGRITKQQLSADMGEAREG